jgi:uncharacterized delta-60 repeat protein
MTRAVPPRLIPLEDRSTPALVGGLDFTFNFTGLSDIAFDLGGAKTDLGTAIAIQPDGKIVVVGSALSGATDVDFAIARLNPDGTLDSTFGSNGLRTVGIDLAAPFVDRASAVAIDSLGRIVVAGTATAGTGIDTDFAVIRLLANGDLDPSFDADGRQTIPFDVSGGTLEDRATGVAIDAQNRIVIVGTVAAGVAGDFDFGVARLVENGELDTSFNTTGRLQIGFDLGGANADSASAVGIDANGRIVVAGTVQISNFGDTDFGVVRLLENGTLDGGFSDDGRATAEFDLGGTNADTAAALAIDGGGNVIVVGSVAVGPAGDIDIGVVRFLANGVFDPGFDTDGKISFGFDLGGGMQDKAVGVAIEPRTGDIVIAATVDTISVGDTDYGIARLTADGSIDPSFSEDGRAVVAFDRGGANADTAAGIALDSSGRIVVVGSIDTATANDRDIGVARLIGNVGLASQLVVGGLPNGTVGSFGAVASGYSALGSFIGPSATAVTRPAVADLNGDGLADLVLGAGPGGGSRVRIFLGDGTGKGFQSSLEFDAFEGNFNGGVFVAAADVDGDGRAEFVISPDVGGGPRASVFSLNVQNQLVKRADFFGIDDPNFRGGARVAMGDIDGDGRADLVVGAGFLGGPRVAIYAGVTLFNPGPNGSPPKLSGDFFAFPGTDAVTLRNGVFVTVGDLDGDGRADLIFGGGPGGGPRVFALSGALIAGGQLDAAYANPVANFFVANDTQTRGGVRLAVKDLDGDDRADLITASGDNLPTRVRVYRGSTVPQPNGVEPPALQEFDPFGLVLANGVFVG